MASRSSSPGPSVAETQSSGFGNYLKSMLGYVIASSIVVGLLAAALILVIGTTSMNFEIGLELEHIDSLWVLLGLPIVAFVVFGVLSPLSYFVHKLFSR